MGRSRTYLKDCFLLAGKTIGIVTSQCPYPWKQWKCRLKGTSEIRGLKRCRSAGAGIWWQWGRSGKDISSETQGRLVRSGKEGGENFQELAREPLGCCPQQTSSKTHPNAFLWFGTKIQFETSIYRSAFVIFLYEGFTCKLDRSPYLCTQQFHIYYFAQIVDLNRVETYVYNKCMRLYGGLTP